MGFFSSLFGTEPPSADTKSGAPLESRHKVLSHPPGGVMVRATDGPMPESWTRVTELFEAGRGLIRVELVDCAMVEDEELLELIEIEIHSMVEQIGGQVSEIERLE